MWWLWLAVACAPTPSEGSFDALTYNVAGLPEGISGSHPAVNMPQIAPLLDAYDLALLQEDFAYHDDLEQGTSLPYSSGWGEPDERPVGDGLTRFSAFPLGPVERVQWDTCYGGIDFGSSDCLAEKGFSVTEVYLAEEVALLVYNHHAEAGGLPEDVEARTADYAQLAAHIAATGPGRAVIVAGDTNLHGFDAGDEPVLTGFLEATGTSDACRSLGCGEEHIDRFLYRDGDDLHLEPSGWAVATEFVDGDGEDLSDHPAIRITWAWEEAR